MASFADLVHPLPLVALPLLVIALERGGPSGFAREAASLLRQHDFAVPPDLILDNILAKLQAGLLLPRESNVPVDVPCNVVGCPDCGVVLPPGTIHETRVLQWPGGFKTGTYEQKRCERCGCVFLSCWMRSPAGTLSVVSPPEMCCFWLLVNHPKTTTFSFVATSLLRHCTSLVVRLRAAFFGICQFLGDVEGHPTFPQLRGQLEFGWVYWRVCTLLWPDTVLRNELVALQFQLAPRPRGPADECLQMLARLLRRRHLHVYARLHTCSVCVQIPSVAVDGKVSFAAALCSYMDESVIQHPLVDQAVPCGCLAFPALGRRACARHAGASTLAPADGDPRPAAAPTRCPAEHALQRLLRDDVWHHACDHCALALVSGVSFWTCGDCNYDLCDACYRQSRPEVQVPPIAIAGGPPAAGPYVLPPTVDSEDEDDNPCGIVKKLATTYYRRQGGVVTAMLACGRVVNIRPLFGKEGCRQVTCLLGEVYAHRGSIRYIIYDNACKLGRFIRKRAARTGTMQQLAQCRFVLDRWHRSNHTACLTPEHRLYMPEVDIDSHPPLAHLNSSWNGSWNAWLDRFVPPARSMSAAMLEVYALLLVDLWNTHVVPQGGTAPPSGLALRPRLKRRPAPP